MTNNFFALHLQVTKGQVTYYRVNIVLEKRLIQMQHDMTLCLKTQ